MRLLRSSRSRRSGHRLGQIWGDLRPEGDLRGQEMAAEIYFATQILESSGALLRVVQDTTRSLEGRQELVATILGGKVSENVVKLVQAAISLSWSEDDDLPNALEWVAAGALIRQARGRKELDRLEKELFAAVRVFRQQPGVRVAVEDIYGYPEDSRVELAKKLFTGVTAEALELIEWAVRDSGDVGVLETLRAFADMTAELAGQSAATVYSAYEISPAQEERLANALSRYYGKPISIHVTIEPELVGGLRIEFGADVLDASLLQRMKNVKASVARMSASAGRSKEKVKNG
ncbi:F-type H+-transporting ATPase subunit delta [Actinobaculum suis]|uniref:ATP synthase subunit delta n=1 Tax=Actinobaculum suis TaxID=1657 RepID=A0A1G7CFA1_9ACTO|nr:F-type H+-transporting ATPase subunit delta [Actinobaculum suis]